MAARSGAPSRVASSLADTRLATLSCLTETEFAELGRRNVTRREIQAGAELVWEQEPTDTIFFLAGGWACQSRAVGDGGRHISAVLVPGDICNLDGLLFDRVNFGVRMLTAGVVLAISRERLLALGDSHPGVARGFTWFGLVENAILSQRTFCLAQMTARARLAHLLCELAVRLGHGEEKGWISFPMPLTQELLGAALGLTAVHINRVAQQLRADGLIIHAQRIVTVPDIAALREVASFDPAYLHNQEPQGGPRMERSASDRRTTYQPAAAPG